MNIKHNLITSTHNKCQAIPQFWHNFKARFFEAFGLGLPLPWNNQRWLYPLDKY
jgi:hypothetical protein